MTEFKSTSLPTWARSIGWVVAAGVASIIFASPSYAQPPTSGELRDAALELMGGEVPSNGLVEVVALGPMHGPWPVRGGVFRVDIFRTETDTRGPSTRRLPVATLKFDVVQSGLLLRLFTEVSQVELRVDAFKREFEAHPEWTDRDAVEALRRAGAHLLPPDAERVRERLSLRSLGRWLTVKSVDLPKFEIDWSQDDPAVHGRARTLNAVHWRVQLRASLADGQDQQYVALIEPFSGALTYLGAEIP
jgi:hypothetical protein